MSDNPNRIIADSAGNQVDTINDGGVRRLAVDMKITESSAIHIDVADEFDTAAEKTAPVSTDKLLIEDSADADSKKYVQIGNMPATGLTSTAPVDVTKAAAVVGVGTTSARHDHKHNVSTAAPSATGVATASAEGAATTLARSDHAHQSNTAPSDVTKATAAIGTSGQPARADHKHDVTTAIASAQVPGDSAAEGSATSLARSDHRHSLPAYGTSSGTICQGNDSRLSDARTPTAHATSHQSGGSDAIKLDDLSVPDDNTDLNASTSAHGLLPKLGGGTTNYLRADGTWAEPPGGELSTPQYFDAYDSAGGTNIVSGWTDIPLGTEREKDSIYTHSALSAEVTITVTDLYVVSLRASTDISSGSGRSDSECRIMLDTGGGYAVVPGTVGAMYNRNATSGQNTATVIAVLSLSSGDKIKGQAQRRTGSDTVILLAGGSALTIMRLRGAKGDSGTGAITFQDDGSSIPNTPHDTLNIVGGGASIEDSGSGVATLTIPNLERATFFDDFIGAESGSWTAYVSGTGSKSIVTDVLGGQIELSTGATAWSESQIDIADYAFSTAGNFYFKARVKLLETSSLYCEIGLQNSTYDDIAWFSNDASSGWNCRTKNSGSGTVTTNVDTLDTDWHIFEIESTGSSIIFRIDGTTVATHTTNLPSDNLDVHFYHESTSSGGIKRMRIDYAQASVDREA